MRAFDILVYANIFVGTLTFLLDLYYIFRIKADKGGKIIRLLQGLSGLWFSFIYFDMALNSPFLNCNDQSILGPTYIRPAITLILSANLWAAIYLISSHIPAKLPTLHKGLLPWKK